MLTPNLLGRPPFAYEQEADAYSCFINEIGFAASFQEVRGLVEANRQDYDAVVLAGFSVEVIPGGHGFMNPFHPSYEPEQAEACMAGCIEFLRDLDS